MNKIRLFWWSEPLLMGKPKENYGDLLGKYLVEKISGKKVVFAWPKKFSFYDWFSPIYVTVGSILANVNYKCIVWGSGIINNNQVVKSAKFLAVRGPETRKVLLNQGYDVPEIYGDPALLLPDFYSPKIDSKFSLGIVPHYKDYQRVKELYKNINDVLIINLTTKNIEHTTNSFLQCKKIISSSLHGLIVSHTYNIPAIWTPFSDNLFGDGIKFKDYFNSIDMPFYKPEIFNKRLAEKEIQNLFEKYPSLPNKNKLEELKKGLMAVCPF